MSFPGYPIDTTVVDPIDAVPVVPEGVEDLLQTEGNEGGCCGGGCCQ